LLLFFKKEALALLTSKAAAPPENPHPAWEIQRPAHPAQADPCQVSSAA
jgi:hypothetical protein